MSRIPTLLHVLCSVPPGILEMTHLTVTTIYLSFLSALIKYRGLKTVRFICRILKYVNVDLYFYLVALTTLERFLPRLIPK